MHSHSLEIRSLSEAGLTLELKKIEIQRVPHSHLDVPGSGTNLGFHY
jgi:hypothetical protein